MDDWELLRSICEESSVCRDKEYKYGYIRSWGISTDYIVFHEGKNLTFVSILHEREAQNYIPIGDSEPEKSICDLVDDPRTFKIDKFGGIDPFLTMNNRPRWRSIRVMNEKLNSLLYSLGSR
jgi:hypothetical protein